MTLTPLINTIALVLTISIFAGRAHAEDYTKEYRVACENEFSGHTESKVKAAQMRAEIERCVKRAKDDPKSIPGWWTDCRNGWITKGFEKEEMETEPPVEISNTSVTITYDELRKLVKELPFILRKIKACDVYRKCLSDREAGKVKHCYANDRRWREFYTGAW
jgi:hypothetical protein